MASGDTLFVLTPLSNEPPDSAFATYDVRNGHPVLDFVDSTTNESAIFSFIMPEHYDGGGLTIDLGYSMASATSGDIDWDIEIERIGDQQQNVGTDSFAAANSVDNTTVPGTSGLVDVVTITFTDGGDMDSIAAGELGRLRVTRDGVSDTASGDAELHFVHVKET